MARRSFTMFAMRPEPPPGLRGTLNPQPYALTPKSQTLNQGFEEEIRVPTNKVLPRSSLERRECMSLMLAYLATRKKHNHYCWETIFISLKHDRAHFRSKRCWSETVIFLA